jgi:hypothetical protein
MKGLLSGAAVEALLVAAAQPGRGAASQNSRRSTSRNSCNCSRVVPWPLPRPFRIPARGTRLQGPRPSSGR